MARIVASCMIVEDELLQVNQMYVSGKCCTYQVPGDPKYHNPDPAVARRSKRPFLKKSNLDLC